MAWAFLRLLALFALIVMPLSMSGAPAIAQPTASAAGGHCEDQQKPADMSKSGHEAMHCTGCTGLPPMDAPFPVTQLFPQTPMELTLAELPVGIVPEIATPPPKLV